MKRVFVVTGAFGHLGINLLKKLLKNNNKVIAFDLYPKEGYFKDDNLKIIKGNTCSKNDVSNIFLGLESYEIIVVHCAAIVSIASKYNQKVYDVNVNGTKNVVDACLKYNVSKLIHISSVHAVPTVSKDNIIKEVNCFDPDKVVGLYAKTKAIATQYVLDATKCGLNACVLHPSGIIGEMDYNIGHTTRLIIDYINHDLTAAINGGYDFVDVLDVCDAIINCVDKGRSGECYIISNKYYSIKDILEIVHNITNQKRIKVYLPLWFIKPLAPLAEFYYKIRKTKPLWTLYSLYTLNSPSNFSNEKARKELNFCPRNLEETLKRTCEWLKKEDMIKK